MLFWGSPIGFDQKEIIVSSEADNWKWWYFVVAGVLIAAYGAYELYDVRISKGLGSIVLAVLCIAIGLFSRQAERKK